MWIGKCLASGAHVDAVRGLVFTPDGKGLLSASWDTTDIHWDVSWLKSTYDCWKGDILTQDLTGGLRELSRFIGHEDCRLLNQFFFAPQVSHTSLALFFRNLHTLFLYPPMANGLRLARGRRLLESGMRILLHCSVSCMVMDRLCPSISVAAGIIWQSQTERVK